MTADLTPGDPFSDAGENEHRPQLTIVTCSNRSDRVLEAARGVAKAAGPEDHTLVVWDDVPSGLASDARRILDEIGVAVIDNGCNAGLSHSRNVAMASRRTNHVVFVDDDVELSKTTVGALRAALADGATVVGCRIIARLSRPLPWWISEGQVHYLAVHPRRSPPVIWGACFGFDAREADRLSIRFDHRLGRTGRRLESGDDTTFVATLASAGGQAIFLDDVSAVHVIDEERLSFTFMARRAFWQGRSEFRRQNSVGGFRKEAVRALHGDVGVAWRFGLAAIYLGLVGAGIALEGVLHVTRPRTWRGVS